MKIARSMKYTMSSHVQPNGNKTHLKRNNRGNMQTPLHTALVVRIRKVVFDIVNGLSQHHAESSLWRNIQVM